jgi:hypothetical protein
VRGQRETREKERKRVPVMINHYIDPTCAGLPGLAPFRMEPAEKGD